MLKFSTTGSKTLFEMRFTSNDDNYIMRILIINDKIISGNFGIEYLIKESLNSNEFSAFEDYSFYETEYNEENIQEFMNELVNQAADYIINNLCLDFDIEKVKEVYIPLFIKFIKGRRKNEIS